MSGRRRSRHSQQGGARNTPQTQPATSWRSEPEEQRLAGRISGSPPRKRPRNQFGRQQRQQHGASHSQPKLQSPVATEMSGVASQSSSSSMPEIPGFYFDVEKNRYFKIAADKIATSSNPYTVLKLKQKEDARIRKAERQKFDDQCKSTVHPRKRHGFTYSHPNASLFLSDREQGGLCRRSSEAWKSCGWETMIRYLRHCSTYKNAGGRTAGDGFVIGAGHIVDFQIHPTEPHVCVARADNSIRVFEYEDFAKQPDSEASQGFTLSHDLSSEVSA
ncbi:hypothetical protein DFS34DRAFT_614816 [Phlyctochytrium arcticum]|nr:hypothetical protein DFS34DRAFT_614816 [Phlyctochytrium arcticum]